MYDIGPYLGHDPPFLVISQSQSSERCHHTSGKAILDWIGTVIVCCPGCCSALNNLGQPHEVCKLNMLLFAVVLLLQNGTNDNGHTIVWKCQGQRNEDI